MGKTIIQKIFEAHSNTAVAINEIIDVTIDIRVARDFGGANVVKHLEENHLPIHDPKHTFFTFDCNPGGCDQKYAENQQLCRVFARKHGIKIYDINSGIGTHLAFDEGLVFPGDTFVSTDSHANILGALGAFGQGMGDIDIAYAFAHGKIWFKVPPTIKIVLKGTPVKNTTPKDVVLKINKILGANGLLGYAAELYGPYVDSLPLDGRVTIASMATEMGGIIILFPTNEKIMDYYKNTFGITIKPTHADPDAQYERTIEIDIGGLLPQIARPGHPEDVVNVSEVSGIPVDSGFIGSCTNGRLEDMRAVAAILRDKTIAPGRILKIVPATDMIWNSCLKEGLLKIFKDAGALVGSAGCAGCAAGQIGQTGKGEVTISTGNRNFTGKQGKGDIYLASPQTVAASLLAGYITTVDAIPKKPVPVKIETTAVRTIPEQKKEKTNFPLVLEGRAWVIQKDNIDTDMIYHNRHLAITNPAEMGPYTFGNLKGYEQFAKEAKKGDIVVVGKNFGCGSSRQQAVDCFKALGISVIVAESFGAIYERNAINSGMPILVAEGITKKLYDKDLVSIDLATGLISDKTQKKILNAKPFSEAQKEIYLRGGLLGGV
ncbi:MAG TPA: aconitase/3-isopropylmalate dehydratase large subunit family protein [Candidatus Thermoplasmatota archaeon]|nr:aconitase/3-isopropylmalate dehydratase large subunit family protein [Candidatus Thermoplasmatota archaeon]